MTKERLYVYDTTLRDGQQTQGVQFSLELRQNVLIKIVFFRLKKKRFLLLFGLLHQV